MDIDILRLFDDLGSYEIKERLGKSQNCIEL